jgi:hypothetical protein
MSISLYYGITLEIESKNKNTKHCDNHDGRRKQNHPTRKNDDTRRSDDQSESNRHVPATRGVALAVLSREIAQRST